MGHAATIYPATKLDLSGNLSTTDILIISSALDANLTVARTGVIEQYLLNGGKASMIPLFQAMLPMKALLMHLEDLLHGRELCKALLLP